VVRAIVTLLGTAAVATSLYLVVRFRDTQRTLPEPLPAETGNWARLAVSAGRVTGMVTAAIYSLWLMQQSFQGKPDPERVMSDFGFREMTAMAVLMGALLWMGLYPQPVLNLAEPAVRGVQSLMAGHAHAALAVLP
jgi:NADH:ubiquinone oxidoreductase subunit 4 (subunit M)